VPRTDAHARYSNHNPLFVLAVFSCSTISSRIFK
jgi:hypothetical protein